jgi:ribosomal protein L29
MTEFKNKTENELKSFLNEKRVALRNFRFGVAGSKVRNVKEGKGLKKDIARILTELNLMKKTVK